MHSSVHRPEGTYKRKISRLSDWAHEWMFGLRKKRNSLARKDYKVWQLDSTSDSHRSQVVRVGTIIAQIARKGTGDNLIQSQCLQPSPRTHDSRSTRTSCTRLCSPIWPGVYLASLNTSYGCIADRYYLWRPSSKCHTREMRYRYGCAVAAFLVCVLLRAASLCLFLLLSLVVS